MLTLYQFPISHYCEKVRWALAYKDLDYRTENLLPGLHGRKAHRMSGRSSLPVLAHNGKTLGESSDIITYLDATFPQKPLTPDDTVLRQQALEWERHADEHIGVHVRLICYQTLLDYPDMVIPFFTVNGPWYSRFLLKRMFPKMRQSMRKLMNINAESARVSRHILDEATDKVFTHLQGKQFLVGGRFTRADLAVASLLAPLCMPEKYGLEWPKRYPDELHRLVEAYADKLQWVNKMYQDYH